MNNKKFSCYNDGVVFVYRAKDKRSNFGAKENVSVLDDMEFVARLDFEECSKREQDIEFANQNDFSLSLKIKTRLLKAVDNGCKAVIDGYLYDVSYTDTDRANKELYLYLEGVRPLDIK